MIESSLLVLLLNKTVRKKKQVKASEFSNGEYLFEKSPKKNMQKRFLLALFVGTR